MYSAIGLDLDGTLLTSKKTISNIDKDCIKKLKKNNIQIIIVSGRHIWEIEKYASELCLSENDFIISCDGQYIHNYKGELLWENKFISKKDLFWIQKNISNYFSFFTDKKDYSLISSKPLKEIFKGFSRAKKGKQKIDLLELSFSSINKIEKVVLFNPKNVNKLDQNYTVHRFDDGKFEVLHKLVSKYAGIEQLKKMSLLENTDDLLYFGDDSNDEECFANLKNCVAMATAPDYLKDMSVFVTRSSDESGVSYAISNMLNW